MKYSVMVELGLVASLIVACSGSNRIGETTGDGGRPRCASTTDCALGVCSEGTCKIVSCAPNTSSCSNGAIVQCGTDGTQQGLAQACASGTYCVEAKGSASCAATVCVAGDTMCVGDTATQCKPDGSGPQPVGEDCAGSGQICYAGECRDPLCRPGELQCDGSTLSVCAEGGTSRAVVLVCSSSEKCDAAQGACRSTVCTPGAMGCDSTRVVTCNDTGSGWTNVGTDCGDDQKTCLAGSCVAQMCQPSSAICKDKSVYTCSPDGSTHTLTQNCTSGQLCIHSTNYAYCGEPACVPNQPFCNGDLLTTCNADGSDFLAGGVDCALTEQFCADGACKDFVCTPGEVFCAGNDVQACRSDGKSSYDAYACSLGSPCREQANHVVSCLPRPCLPSSTACVGEQLGVCSADGTSVTATADCGAAAQICTLDGCAMSAVDATHDSTDLATGFPDDMHGNVLFVESPRKLTQIEMELDMPAPRSGFWTVYEQTNRDAAGEFEPVLRKAATLSGSGLLSSGPISVPLTPGKSYFIGVTVTDGNYVYHFDTRDAPIPFSFGHLVDSIITGNLDTFDSYPPSSNQIAYHQRLTTTAP